MATRHIAAGEDIVLGNIIGTIQAKVTTPFSRFSILDGDREGSSSSSRDLVVMDKRTTAAGFATISFASMTRINFVEPIVKRMLNRLRRPHGDHQSITHIQDLFLAVSELQPHRDNTGMGRVFALAGQTLRRSNEMVASRQLDDFTAMQANMVSTLGFIIQGQSNLQFTMLVLAYRLAKLTVAKIISAPNYDRRGKSARAKVLKDLVSLDDPYIFWELESTVGSFEIVLRSWSYERTLQGWTTRNRITPWLLDHDSLTAPKTATNKKAGSSKDVEEVKKPKEQQFALGSFSDLLVHHLKVKSDGGPFLEFLVIASSYLGVDVVFGSDVDEFKFST